MVTKSRRGAKPHGGQTLSVVYVEEKLLPTSPPGTREDLLVPVITVTTGRVQGID